MSTDEDKIKEFFKSRKETFRKVSYKAETMRQIWEKEYPHFSEIARIYEIFSREIEDLYEINEVLVGGLIHTRKMMNIIFEWIEYFKAEINRLKEASQIVSAKPVQTDEKVKSLEERQQAWEREYKPVLEYLKKWINREEERQKRLQQCGVV